MISIVATYYSRPLQLKQTLDSFVKYNPDDFNVVIVDDNSPQDIDIPDYDFEVTILKLGNKTWINPCIAFNIGFGFALKSKPDIIILQNAECYHAGDILGYAKKITDKDYISFGCYSLGKGEGVDKKDLNKKAATGNGDSAWYNHPIYRPEALHFCCAITAENLIKINGFDERFAHVLGYEDNYFIHQIRSLGLKIEITAVPFVFHQYHYDIKSFTFDQVLYGQAGALFRELSLTKNYKARHIITPDLCI